MPEQAILHLSGHFRFKVEIILLFFRKIDIYVLVFMFHQKNLAYCTALKASSKSSMISSIFSVPIDRRIVLGLIPDPNNSSSVI